MAQSTVALVNLEARALLNDVGAAVFTDAVLAPFGLIAYRDLQLHMMHNNIPIEKKIDTLTTINAGVLLYPNPSDMVEPLTLFERTPGTTDTFIEMIQRDWEPQLQQTDHLRFWCWREEKITLLGSTAAREVKLEYIKGLTAVAFNTPATVIPVQQCDAYMGPRIAELASMYIGNNPSRAEQCAEKADEGLELILGVAVKNKQAICVKRVPYRGKRRAVFSRIPRV